MQWYPGDWQRDFGVRSCSLAARGLWREMLDVMHDGEPRGTMQVGRKIINDPAEIAALVSAKPGDDVAALLEELESAGVFSRNESGAIYSRRMVRDSLISEVRRSAGSEGGKVAQAKVRAKVEQTPAGADAEEEVELEVEDFDDLWAVWERKTAKATARKAFEKSREKLPPMPELLSIVATLQATDQWSREGRRYQPHLSTWLNREGWHDEPQQHVASDCFRCGGKGSVTIPDPAGSCAVYNPETGQSERPTLTEPCPRCAGARAA